MKTYFFFVILLSFLYRICSSELQSKPKQFRRQLPNNFFGGGFNWDYSDHSNFNNNNQNNNRDFNNFNRDGIVFEDDSAQDDFRRRPWNPGRNWGTPSSGTWNNNDINPTPSPFQTSTVAVPGMGTTRSPCEDACQVTREYNPVCGTNGITYANVRWLKCAQDCGRRVAISYYGSCPRTG